jgi:hypothetical protein
VADVLGVCFPEPDDPDRVALAMCDGQLLIVHTACWSAVHRQMAAFHN